MTNRDGKSYTKDVHRVVLEHEDASGKDKRARPGPLAEVGVLGK
jgi:hypothetical protein